MMFRLLAVCTALAVASPAFAEDKEKPKPNTLTPKEIADGWILLFDGETTFGWKIDGTAEVKDGALVLGGAKSTTAVSTTTFTSYELQMQTSGAGAIALHSIKGGSHSAGLNNQSSIVRMTVVGSSEGGSSIENSTTADPNGAKTSITAATNGPAELRLEVPAGGSLSIKSLKLRPECPRSLFTGKNLDGWKVNAADPKRMSSKWEVTKDGELSLKNGPGDLVTEKEFDNFVLQLECKTLGKALNSGAFFRCIPGQYQNGYEAQIHNGFKDDDRTKPSDFGTGAVYRRIAARRVVANDNEWFTMTVVANGKRITTWVNGYQTVDWTDDRKESDNPRQGYRAAKGPLSIQGHDATTDILFRNIRIAELPK
ncbi:Secreted glycosyl hydrolase OS=uncultured planctomycete GN=HGMM_F11G08C09 PE=4 SV=1: DUF1080 [Gemmata massiliana]|uniref:3-keto-alpha-glucoside-1,2-lyase/3-keto-2-hydroxy-glucal hydratase domain-containing protein n=1 Tax=Gemmata massiliana TaxID=1210884 RepID=A0A6P2D3F7_9BACT|nr:DUF1080 domain-containing protein [Gemmata massiliana]VTR95407.1 Secreted glycosyl hydrolase OS=uncultured planctomycete GN=HGMM_F11G08C09 PE=4 SV=1: DUF1080 [Gemmata massiliana]